MVDFCSGRVEVLGFFLMREIYLVICSQYHKPLQTVKRVCVCVVLIFFFFFFLGGGGGGVDQPFIQVLGEPYLQKQEHLRHVSTRVNAFCACFGNYMHLLLALLFVDFFALIFVSCSLLQSEAADFPQPVKSMVCGEQAC